jgi:ATP-dependent exoDNAse (exonuclease V) beta subunit
VLKRNYLNTRGILSAAYAMVQELDAAEAEPGDLVSSLIVPDQALREGPRPELACLDSAQAVREHAKDWIGARLARGVAPGDILVLGHNRLGMEKFAGWLEEQKIPASFLPERRTDGTVGVSTIHSSKGLDARHVLILNTHELDGLKTRDEARRLLYIGMTRAGRALRLVRAGVVDHGRAGASAPGHARLLIAPRIPRRLSTPPLTGCILLAYTHRDGPTGRPGEVHGV